MPNIAFYVSDDLYILYKHAGSENRGKINVALRQVLKDFFKNKTQT